MSQEKSHIANDQFDRALLLSLLSKEELFNEQNNDIMAQQIFAHGGATPSMHNARILKQLEKDFSKGRVKWWLNLLIAGIFITALVAYFTRENSPATNEVTAALPEENNPQPTHQKMLVADQPAEEKTMRRDAEMVLPVADDSVLQEEIIPLVPETPGRLNFGHTHWYIPEDNGEENADVPAFTEAQRKKNHKRKMNMFRDIAKKKTFTSVLSGPSWRNGERFQVSQFFLQGTEVSNWQYTVFLSDLVIQGRVDDYLAARPVKGNWKTVGIPEFEETYATAEGFEKFPVLNISRAGAEMYCAWLTAEMNKAIDAREIKWNESARPDFRLPTDIEWLRAARGNDSTLQFPWGAKYNALQNARGCYLCNFNYTLSKDVLLPEGPEGSKGCISTNPNTRAVITTAGRSIDTLVLAPEYSYNGSVFGHYLLLGNAAEMVTTYDATQPGNKGAPRAMGGSWYSHADEVRIESKQQFVGVTDANVNIGFRVVMTYR